MASVSGRDMSPHRLGVHTTGTGRGDRCSRPLAPLPGGELIRAKSRDPRSSGGLDWDRLLDWSPITRPGCTSSPRRFPLPSAPRYGGHEVLEAIEGYGLVYCLKAQLPESRYIDARRRKDMDDCQRGMGP